MLKNNKLNLLISIVCAIVLWAYITAVVNPETERTISGVLVELVNIDALNDKGFTVNEGMTYSIDVNVKGARSEVNKLKASNFQATADVTGYRRGLAAVPVKVTTLNTNEPIDAVPSPETIPVEIVDRVTVYKTVKLEFEDQFEQGQEPGFVRITPNEMEVSGVASAVDSIDYIRAIVPKGKLTEQVNTFRLDNVFAVDKSGKAVNNVGLSQQTVEVTGALCTTKWVPLRIETIGETNESIEVTYLYIPSFITIRGAKEVVEDITEVVGRPVDLSVITSTVEIPIEEFLAYLPEGVEVADASEGLSVRIEVQGIARTEFTYTADMIEIRNLFPSITGHVNTGSVTVTVFAPRDVLTGLRQEDIKLFVDAYGRITAGSAIEVDVQSECAIDVKEITIEPKKVRVTFIKD